MSIRKRWRKQKRKDRSREKQRHELIQNIETPPSTSDEIPSIRQKQQQIKRRKRNEAKVVLLALLGF